VAEHRAMAWVLGFWILGDWVTPFEQNTRMTKAGYCSSHSSNSCQVVNVSREYSKSPILFIF